MKTGFKFKTALTALALGAILRAHSLYAGANANYSLSLAGSSQYVSVPASPALTPTPLTFEAWVYPTDAKCNTIISRGDGSSGATTDYIFQVGYNGTTCGVMNVGFFGVGAWDSSASLIPTNAWTHVAVTFDGTNKLFYINGVLDKTANRPGALYQSGSVMYIGRQGTGCDCNLFEGGLSEVRMWDTVRSASQIASDMNVSANGSQPGLTAYYHLNEGSGTTANDASGNGHTGTLQNGADWANTIPVCLGASALLEGPAAGTDCDLLVAPSTFDWTATNNASWLHLSATNQSGKGSTNVVFTFDANNSGTRSGTLTIAGQTLTVTQAGSNYVAASASATTIASAPESTLGVAVDGVGNVYFAESAGNLIDKWSPASNSVSAVVTSGLTDPLGLAIDDASNIYTVDGGDNTLKEWVAAVKTNNTLVTGLDSPNGVAVDAFGNLYIADSSHNAVKKWSVWNQTITTLASGLDEPYGAAVDAAGNVYFSNTKASEIEEWQLVNSNVTLLASSGLNQPRGVAVDGAGNVFFSDTLSSAIKEWSPATGAVTTLASSGLSQPNGIAVDGADNVYFADTANNAVKELPRAFLDPSTKYETAAAGTDALSAVLPATENLLGPFAPSTNQSWLSITGTANGVVSFSFTTNSGNGRIGTITLLGQAISVIQAGVPNSGVISPATLSEGPGSGSDSVALTSPDTSWTANANASWLHLNPSDESGTNSATVAFTFDANTGGTRSGTITIAGQTLTVIQAGSTYIQGDVSNVFLDPTPKFESDTAVNDTLPPVFPTTQNLTGTNTPTSDQPWLTITGVANGVVSFTFGADTGAARLAHINLLGQSIPIVQTVLGAANRFDGPAAGMDSIVLGVAPATPAWAAVADASWLHLSTSNGTGSANLIFSLDANTGGPRSGTFTIAGQTLAVTQAGSTYVTTSAPLTRLAAAGNPYGVAVDYVGNVYFPYDTFHVEEWLLASNSVTTLVSNGIDSPDGVAVDRNGNVYFADSSDNAIKEWVPVSSSVITLVAEASNSLASPDGVALDLNSNVYIGDRNDSAIKEWMPTTRNLTTLVSSPQVSVPGGVAADVAGNVYIADTYDSAIKEWSPVNSNLTTLITAPTVSYPYGVAVDGGGNLFIADTSDNKIKEWSAVSNNVTTLLSVSPNAPHNLAVDANGNLYITDDYNYFIEEQPRAWIDPTSRLEPAAGGADALPSVIPSTENLLAPFAPVSDQSWLTINGVTNGVVSFSVSANSGLGRTSHITLLSQSISVLQAGFITLGETNRAEGPAAGVDSVVLAAFDSPWTAAANASWLHLSAANQGGFSSTNVVFSFDANTNPTRSGTLTIGGQTLTVTQAGSTYIAAPQVTTLVSSGFTEPNDVAVDGSGNVFVVDSYGTLREWSPVNNSLTLLASQMNNPQSVGVDGAGNAYVANSGSDQIDEWVVASSTFTNLVPPGLDYPNGVAIDGMGNVDISDSGDQAIKQWSLSSNSLSVLVPLGNDNPYGLSIDAAGNLYFILFNGSGYALDQWSPQTQVLTALATPGFSSPRTVAVDGAGNVYIADDFNQEIKEWSAASNNVINVVSSGLQYPAGVAVDALGDLYIADTDHNAVKEWPRAFFDPTPKREPANAGSDVMPVVLPVNEILSGPFAPASDQSWLAITGTTGGVVSFSYAANNTGAARTANLYMFGIAIPVTQSPAVFPTFLTGATILGNGSFQFAFTNSRGASFTVLSSTNVALPLTNWIPVGAPVEGPPGQYQFTGAASNSQSFYILRSP